MSIITAQPRPVWYSPNAQNPEYIVEMNGVQYIGDKNGFPRFNIDGGPIKEGKAHQCVAKGVEGYRCVRFATAKYGYTVCQRHGSGSPRQGRPGGNPAAVGLNRFKNSLPENLQKRFEDAIHDPELMALDREIAMLRVREETLMSQLPDERESAANFELLRDGMKMLKEAHKKKGQEGTAMLLQAASVLDKAYEPLVHERAHWKELNYIFQQRSKLITRETERRKAMRNYITAEEAWALVSAIVTIINDEVEEMETKNRIAARIQVAMKAAKKS